MSSGGRYEKERKIRGGEEKKKGAEVAHLGRF